MHTRLTRALAAAGALLCLTLAAHAAAPLFWQVSTRADFLKGEVENLSVDSEGRLLLGPATSLINDSSAPFLWTLAAGPNGSVYAGTGNEGRLVRFDRDGTAATIFDAPELQVQAIVSAPGGGLYVATSPDGKVYRVDEKGTATPFFDPEDKYIWTLALDGSGNLYAGTGSKGVIYRIKPDGTAAPFYRTKATHVLSLVFDGNGNLLAGTESPGRVLRIDTTGKAFVVLDSEFQEIRALHLAPGGVIYAAAVGAAPSAGRDTGAIGTETTATPIPTVSSEITSVAVIDLGVATSGGDTRVSGRDEPRAAKGAVYRISPDGEPDIVWESADDSPYDLVVEQDGALLVGTGNKGKIFRVLPGEPPRIAFLAGGTAQQITRFLATPAGEVFFATANPGKLLRLSTTRADRGTYTSEVRDADTVSTWGSISWRATTPSGSRLRLFTRSGNSETPDDTWSEWSEPYTREDGQQITSPKARYLQWKAELAGSESPVLTSVTVAYLQRNLRPKVTGVTVHPAGTVFQRPFSTGEPEIAGFDGALSDVRQAAGSSAASGSGAAALPAPSVGRRIYQKGLQTFMWKAADPNDDSMQYDVMYRREGDVSWKALKRGLADAILVWDTTAVPNGRYLIKVVASDAPSNPLGTALVGELEGGPFDVDNSPPAIAIKGLTQNGGRTVLSFEVHDDHSVVQRVDYSIDAERWRPIYPTDGIADSKAERFELTLDGEVAARTIVLRAVDAMNNVATSRGDRTAGDTQAAGR